jgi:nicotinate-nucleotide adenylyltransferase
MNILLFGGAFNPPHLGHSLVIEQAFELIPDIDELWILPTYNHTFNKELAPAADRLAMCQLMVTDLPTPLKKKVSICTYEIDTKSPGSTYQTHQALVKKYPHHTFSFLAGSDQLPVFNKWVNYQALLKVLPFYIYPRGSHRHDITYPHMTLLESPTQVITNLSSTMVRARLKSKLSTHHLLLPSVADYITSHHLYL